MCCGIYVRIKQEAKEQKAAMRSGRKKERLERK